MRIDHAYPLGLIANMDKTPVTFNLPSNITIDEIGAQSVSIRTTRHEKTNFTVVLTCIANGTKLSLLIIFKPKKIPCGNFSQELLYKQTKQAG